MAGTPLPFKGGPHDGLLLPVEPLPDGGLPPDVNLSHPGGVYTYRLRRAVDPLTGGDLPGWVYVYRG